MALIKTPWERVTYIVFLGHDSCGPGYQHGLSNHLKFIHRGMQINCKFRVVGLCYAEMRFFHFFAMGHLGGSACELEFHF